MINITRPEREAKEREIVEMRVPMHRMLPSRTEDSADQKKVSLRWLAELFVKIKIILQ